MYINDLNTSLNNESNQESFQKRLDIIKIAIASENRPMISWGFEEMKILMDDIKQEYSLRNRAILCPYPNDSLKNYDKIEPKNFEIEHQT